ncbi:hypothetical protein F5Y10DRAFT_288373 [Nemania abortiva]|nr:hypothetical protein F5Y10DRAFT_288373 [Nemania abortiva]
MATPVDTGAASDGDSSSSTQKKRQKNGTNPRVERVKELIQAYDQGYRLTGQDVCRQTLDLNEYMQLREEINDDPHLSLIFEDKLRYEYTVDNRGKDENQFAIRMPTKFSTCFSAGINGTIIQQQMLIKIGKAECGVGVCRGKFCKDSHTKEIIQSLNGGCHTTVTGEGAAEHDIRRPDLSYGYYYQRSEHPGLVVEVGWSEESPSLHEKCKWYIENSRGEIRTVIGVDLHDLYKCYPKRMTKPKGPSEDDENKATDEDEAKMANAIAEEKALGKIFVWRASMDSDTGNVTAALDDDAPKIFRDENGKAVGEVALCLSLEDFVSKEALEEIGASHNPEFRFMSADLCYDFNRAIRGQISQDRDIEKEEERKKHKK